VTRPLVPFIAILVATAAFAQDAPPLTIERAVELALTRNERAAIADTTTEAAEARVRRAQLFFFPRVDITGVARRNFDIDATDNTISAAALLTQPLFDARALPLMRQARLDRDATKLTAAESKRLLAFDAADAFLTTLGFEQVQIAAEHRREFARTSLDDVRARFEAGLVSSNDVTKVELELATAERGFAQSSGDVEAARVQLGNLLNTDVSGPLAAPDGLLDAADDAATFDVAAAQQRRNDIAATRSRVEALREFAREPLLRFIPSVLFTAQTRNINDGPVSDRNNDGFVGVTLAWPLFDAGIRRAERAERVANVRGGELALEFSLRNVDRQLRSAAVQLTTEQAALREATAALRAARKNADETNELYRQGLASALELADSTQRLFDAEVAEVTARYRMALAYLSLREASGEAPVGR